MQSSPPPAIIGHGSMRPVDSALKGCTGGFMGDDNCSTDDDNDLTETDLRVKDRRLDDPAPVTGETGTAESPALRLKKLLYRSTRPPPLSAGADDTPSRPPPELAPNAQDTQVLGHALKMECDRSASPEVQPSSPDFANLMASDRQKPRRTYSKKDRSATILNSTSPSQPGLSEDGGSADEPTATTIDRPDRSYVDARGQGLQRNKPDTEAPDTIGISSTLGDAEMAFAVAKRTVTWRKRRLGSDDASPTSCKRRKAAEVANSGEEEVSESRQKTLAKATKVGSTSKSPKVLLTLGNNASRAEITASLKSLRITVIKRIPPTKSNFVCVVGDSDLKTTAKVLRTLSKNRPVVTSRWVQDSKRHREALQPEDYIHEDVADTMELDRTTLFQGKILFFTDTLVKRYKAGWRSIKALAKETGAVRVETGGARKLSKLKTNWICFGNDTDDATAMALLEQDHDVFHKNMLTQSILAGEVDLDSDEFRLHASAIRGPDAKRVKGRRL